MESPSRVPSLLQLCLRALVANGVSAATQCKEFVDMEQKERNTIMKWEHKKFLQTLPDLLKSNEINHELKKLDEQRALIKSVTSYSENYYGGFVRDFYCSGGVILPHDIDVSFFDERALNAYLVRLIDKYDVEMCDNVVPHHPNENPVDICSHCSTPVEESKYATMFSRENFPRQKKYSDAALVKSILVIDRKTAASIQMDLIIPNGIPVKDFDVNCLTLKYGYRLQSTIAVSTNTIEDHIAKKEFFVLDNQGNYRSVHRFGKNTIEESDVSYTIYDCNGVCLCRHSAKGKKIQERIVKMQLRGWKVINPVCGNPLCILSSEQAYQQYVEEVSSAKAVIKEREEKKREEKEREEKKREEKEREEKRKQKDIHLRKKLQKVEIVQLERLHQRIDVKELTAARYECQTNKRPSEFRRIDFKNYRKAEVNKKRNYIIDTPVR